MALITEISQLLQEPPTTTGALIGSGDWRLHVERISGNADGAVWDLDDWSTGGSDGGEWAELGWESLNDVMRGMEWTRGAEQPNGRPSNGEITITLWNPDGASDPWVNYGNTRPGTIMRAGITSATDTRADGWIPLWTGVVDSWPVAYVGARESGYRADSFTTVTLVETLSWLARIDENTVTPVGSGDTVVPRIDRLLDDADWPFGVVSLFGPAGAPTIPLQSTDMAANRLTELYLTADSTTSVVMPDVTGAALITDRSRFKASRLAEFSTADLGSGDQPLIILSTDHTVSGDSLMLAYDADTLETVNDPEPIVNDHRYTRVGGTQQVFGHELSIGTFGRSTRARNDLIMTTDADALAVAEADNDREALTALRVDRVEVVATGQANTLLAVAAADWGDGIWMFPPLGTDYDGSGTGVIRSLTHTLTPLTTSSVHWTASYAVDFYDFIDVPGAILPAA